VKKVLNENITSDIENTFEYQAKAALGLMYDLTDEESYENIEYDGRHTFTFNDEEWYVFEDYDSACEYAVEYNTDLFEQENIMEYIVWDNMPGGLEAYVDKKWFEECMEEDYEAYVDDIETEGTDDDRYENRLEQEMAEAHCDTREEYVEYLCNNAGDPIEWFIGNFGKSQFNDVVKENNLIDLEEVAKSCVDTDGPANTLAHEDGKEVELDNGYYAYRIS